MTNQLLISYPNCIIENLLKLIILVGKLNLPTSMYIKVLVTIILLKSIPTMKVYDFFIINACLHSGSFQEKLLIQIQENNLFILTPDKFLWLFFFLITTWLHFGPFLVEKGPIFITFLGYPIWYIRTLRQISTRKSLLINDWLKILSFWSQNGPIHRGNKNYVHTKFQLDRLSSFRIKQ